MLVFSLLRNGGPIKREEMVIPVSSLPPKEQSITYENKNIVWTFKAGFIIYHFKILVHYLNIHCVLIIISHKKERKNQIISLTSNFLWSFYKIEWVPKLYFLKNREPLKDRMKSLLLLCYCSHFLKWWGSRSFGFHH